MSEFFQEPPSLGNQYDEDRVLQSYLEWKLPHPVLNEIQPELHRMGKRAITDIYQLSQAAETTPPRHIPYDPWGKRIDLIEVSQAWKELDRISAEEKLVAIGYEREHEGTKVRGQICLRYGVKSVCILIFEGLTS